MNEFEKIDKLRERANVTYEEARDALKEANGDLLDAMVILEKQGKATQPNVSSYTTRYEEQPHYERVEQDAPDPDKEAAKRFGGSLRRFFRVIFSKLRHNALRMRNRSGEEVFRIPLWLLLLIFFVFWNGIVVVLVVLLFFGNRYDIVGRDDMSDANEILSRAGKMADDVKEEFQKEHHREG